MAAPVPRLGRILDLVGALVFLGGAVLYARSWLGLRALEDYARAADAPAFAAVTRANELSRLSRAGLAIMAVGVLIAIAAAVVARSRRARSAQ